MRHIALWMMFLCLSAVATGCGNANDGKAFSPYKKASSAITGTSDSSKNSNALPLTKLLFCKNPLMILGNAEYVELFSGSTVCPTEGASSNVRGASVFFKVNEKMPVNARLCAIPFVGDAPAAETCFPINGQVYIMLSTNQYSSLVILSENNLAAYKAFIMDPNATAPPRAVYSL